MLLINNFLIYYDFNKWFKLQFFITEYFIILFISTLETDICLTAN